MQRKGFIFLWALLLLCGIALAGCTESEEPGNAAAETAIAEAPTGSTADGGAAETASGDVEAEENDDATTISCASFEEEVEPGICGYIVDCDDAKSCEKWSAGMIKEMNQWFGDLTYSEEWEIGVEASEREPDEIAGYAVRGDEIDLEPATEDEEYYEWLWDRFVWIIPEEQREMITRFEVYDHDYLMAYVVQDDENYEQWTYAANQVQATYETERVMTDIHEFGHLLSLNAQQIDPYAEESACGTHWMDEGCPHEEAYIYQFYKQFWEDSKDRDEHNYVTEYAMSSFYEDFAESWSYFVMTPRPKGNAVPDRKVAFFYDYDELVMLKASILARAASWMDRNIEWG